MPAPIEGLLAEYATAIPVGMVVGALLGLAYWWLFGRDPGDPL